MDNRPTGNEERRACALRYLARTAARGAGYELRGVRGWAHADDVRRHCRGYRWSELLAALAEAGQLDQELASPPGAMRASHVYRISAAGWETARALTNEPLPPVPPAGPPEKALRIHAPPDGRAALEILREAYERGPKPHRMNGEPGWLTASELREPLDAWNQAYGSIGSYRSIQDTDLLALLQSGLIEKAHVTLAWGRTRPVVLYRATEMGRTAEFLEWHELGESSRPPERGEKNRGWMYPPGPLGMMFGSGG
jgi:hypothetical protein